MLTMWMLTILTGVHATATAPAPPAPPNPFRVEWRDNKIVIRADGELEIGRLPGQIPLQIERARDGLRRALTQTVRDPGELQRYFDSDERRVFRKLAQLPDEAVEVAIRGLIDKRFEREGWAESGEFPENAVIDLSERDWKRLAADADKFANAELEAGASSERPRTLAAIGTIAVAYIFLRGFVERTAPSAN